MCGAMKNYSLIKKTTILLIVVLIIILGCTISLTTTAVAQANNGDNGEDDENETSYEDLAWTLGLTFVIIGIVLLIAEAASPGFFIGIPATILIILGLFGIIMPGLFFSWISPVLALIVAVPVTVFVIWFYGKLAPPEAPTTTVGDSLIGKTGIVITETEPDSYTHGKVRIGSDIWSATSDKPIRKGTRVEVLASEGVHVILKEIKSK